jgi:hypothetical protein
MIEKHIVNIGHMRCGTTWLWVRAGFDSTSTEKNINYALKENNLLMTDLDFDKYTKFYRQFKISANFNPNLWKIDRELIKFVQQHASHITFIVRNPFNFIERVVDYIIDEQELTELTNFVIHSGFIKYYDIVTRWASGSRNFKIFFFEDLESNPVQFLRDYMSFCELPIPGTQHIEYYKKINAISKPNKISLSFTTDQIDNINQEICKFQKVVDRDLSHWML